MTINSSPWGAMNRPKDSSAAGMVMVPAQSGLTVYFIGGDQILQHDRTVDADRHEVCPCTVSMESTISGDSER